MSLHADLQLGCSQTTLAVLGTWSVAPHPRPSSCFCTAGMNSPSQSRITVVLQRSRPGSHSFTWQGPVRWHCRHSRPCETGGAERVDRE